MISIIIEQYSQTMAIISCVLLHDIKNSSIKPKVCTKNNISYMFCFQNITFPTYNHQRIAQHFMQMNEICNKFCPILYRFSACRTEFNFLSSACLYIM